MECIFWEFILERTSWNVCFGSSFWQELHGMYVLQVHFEERTSWNVCFASSFWRELHGMYVLRVHFGENFRECMFCKFILERTSWNVLLFEACMATRWYY